VAKEGLHRSTECRVKKQPGFYGISGGQSGIGTGFFFGYCAFLLSVHQCAIFIASLMSPMLHNLSS
jgi:hypothetical protein